jgi:hypothetical protein
VKENFCVYGVVWCVRKTMGKFLYLSGDVLQDAARSDGHRSRTDGLELNFSTTTLLSTPLKTAVGIRAIGRIRPAHIAHTLV